MSQLQKLVRDLKDTDAPWARKMLAAVTRNEGREAMRRKMGLSELVAKPKRPGVTTYDAVTQAQAINSARGVR